MSRIAFISLLFFATGAQAGFISDVFEPVSSDVSVQQLLRPLFGCLVDSVLGSGGDGEATVLMQIIKFLLVSIVVPFGGLLLLYSTYHGISAGAMTGELFGDKNVAYWVAVRTVIGFGMVAPTPFLKGLGLINLTLMWLTLSGVGAASSLWSVVVDQVTSKPIILTSSTPDTAVFDAMLRGEICAAIYNNDISEAGENHDHDGQFKKWSLLSNDSSQTIIGWKREGGTTSGGCGRIIVDRSASIGIDAHISQVGELGTVTEAKFAGEKVQAQMQAQTENVLNELHTRAHEVAQMIIDSRNVIGATSPPVESYYNLMQWYKTQQQKAAQSIAESGMTDVASAFKTNAKREGWATAGFYFLGLSTFQQAVNRAIQMEWVTAKPATWAGLAGQLGDDQMRARGYGQWKEMEGYIGAGHQQVAAGRSLPSTITDLGDNGSNFIAAIGTWLNDLVRDSIEMNATPLAASASLGSSMVDYGWKAIGGATAGAVLSFIPGVVGNFAETTGQLAGKVGALLIVVGWFLLAVCLLPAFAWFRRILHWAIRVVVAQIAGPMWVILHVHHAGDGLEGNAGNGYRLALQLVLAPVLDITALAIVYALMIVFTPFMNHTLMKAVLDMGSGSFTIIVVFFTLVANVWLVFELLALFEKIEHQVLAFVGGRGSDLSLDNEGNDKNRMYALMQMVSRKIPTPNVSGKKGSGAEGGASITGDNKNLNKLPNKITNDHLMPKDK
jgi:conjugal transfer/type IV secretion protein DotA/TraY